MVRRHISDDLKETALAMSLQGIGDSEIREYTGISERSLKRLRHTYRNTGAVSAKPDVVGRPRMLTAMEVKFLCDCVARQPDMALSELQAELREACAIDTSIQTIARSLQREGYTMKTVTRPALEQNKQDRETFRTLIDTHFRPEQLIFANESHFNRLPLRRPYAWSIRGERASRYECFLRGTKYSILPALSLNGILHLEVIKNTITSEDFIQFIQGLLPHMNEWPLPMSVLVIDNVSIHKAAGIREMVEERGARLLYLPSYSPDFNPIELASSTIQAWVRENHDRINQELESENGVVDNIFQEAVHSVTTEQAKGWFTHCGYHEQD